jgi:glycosyltransferase involved in cell wall biosynthesis
MRNGLRIGVVIPALDEEDAIGRVIADIPGWVDDIVVVDNGSRDGTASVAAAAGARVVSERERGYGAACQAGITALETPDIVAFLDGDYSDDPREMGSIIDPVANGEVDLVIGSRVLGACEPAALTPHQRLGNWLACRLIGLIWRVTYTDLGPFRAIRRDALDRLGMTDRNFGWTVEMQVKSAAAGLRCLDVPVSYRRRIGTSKISGTIRGSLKAGVTILSVIARSAGAPGEHTGSTR